MSTWEVECTDEFDDWYQSLTEEDQDAVIARVDLLETTGPGLGPRRTAILLIGGDKSPDDPGSPNSNQWYDHYTPTADDLYDTHLEELREEGLI